MKFIRFICSTILVCFVVLVCNASTVFAAVPQIVNYQGALSDDSGNPVDATVTIIFSLYDVAAGPDVPLWRETQQVVVRNGLFSVELGTDTGNQLNSSIFDGSLFLGVRVGADAEMTPRQQITSAGFSIRTAEADRLNGLRANQIAVPAGAVMHFNLPSCPTDWSDFATGQGRTLVGATSNLGGTVGTPLASLEDRTHSHTIDPTIRFTSNSGFHNHSVDPPPSTTSSDAHNHIWSFRTDGAVGPLSVGSVWNSYQANGVSEELGNWGNFGTGQTEFSTIRPLVEFEIQNNTFYTNIDTHSHTVNTGAFNSASAGTHSHTVDIPITPTTSTSATMPYVQLRVCQKD